MSSRRKLAAVVFADIVGFSRQVSADENTGLERRRRMEQLVKGCAVEHAGRVIKSIGDAVMLEFGSAADAVGCSLEIQRLLRDLSLELNQELATTEPLQVRIGVHVGDVVEEDDDLYGNAVNIAQRVQKMARPGAICMTREVYNQIRPVLRLRCVPVEAELLRSLPQPMEVLEVRGGEEPVEDVATALAAALQPAPPPSGLRLRLPTTQELAVARQVAAGWGRWLIDREDPNEVSEPMTLAHAQELAAGPDMEERIQRFARAMTWLVIGAFLFSVSGFVDHLSSAWDFVSRFLWLGGFASTVTGALSIGQTFRGYDPEGLDAEILTACRHLGPVPPEIGEPISRSLSAYVSLQHVGNEPAWAKARVPANRHVQQARAQLLTLLERAQQLNRVRTVLQRFAGRETVPPEYRELAELYRHHCAKLDEAACVFEQAEASLSRALLAVSDQPVGRQGVQESLQQMNATFQALAEVLESIDDVAAARLAGRGQESGTTAEQQAVRRY